MCAGPPCTEDPLEDPSNAYPPKQPLPQQIPRHLPHLASFPPLSTTSSTTSANASPSILHSTECSPWAPTTPTIFTTTITTTTTTTTTSPTDWSTSFWNTPTFSPVAKNSSPPSYTRGEIPLFGQTVTPKSQQNFITTITESVLFPWTLPRTDSYTARPPN